ncbi:MAG: ABC transporter permease [Eubacterium sp.]|nr:ABC transporter permease [Eubacterium sp.]
MADLIWCECLKLKRKKFVLLVALSAFLFPIPVAMIVSAPQYMSMCSSKAEAFDELYQMTLGYGVELLLPCVIGVLAAILFFMERDNDTFKNLCTIPVTSTQMVFAKIILLFAFSILFCVMSTIATILCGSVTMEVNGVAYKLLLAVELGIFITAGTLPLVVLIVFFSKNYIFSILMCVFYSVLSLTMESMFSVVPRAVCWLMPIPLLNFWTAGELNRHGWNLNLKLLEAVIPTTTQTFLILCVMAVVSMAAIDFFYRKRRD